MRRSKGVFRISGLSCFLYLCAALSSLLVVPSVFGQPHIFWVSDPVRPNEAVIVIGDGLSDSKVEVKRLDDVPGESPSPVAWTGPGISVEALQVSDRSLKFIMPPDLKDGVYGLRITAGGLAETRLINAPIVYWNQGDDGASASPGGWLRLFGRSMGQRDKTALLMAIAREDKRLRRLMKAELSGLWEARFNIPGDLKSGEYDLYFHNGTGDSSAWVAAGLLKIKVAAKWPGKVFNVRDFGAVGDGVVNDTNSVLTAIKAAESNRGGVVYFPRGRYLLQQALLVPQYVVLRGERRDLVNIVWDEMKSPPPCLIQGSGYFAIEDLTVYASNHFHVIGLDERAMAAGQGEDVRIQRVTVRAAMYRGHLTPEEVDQRLRNSQRFSQEGIDTIRLGGKNIVITDCDIYGSGRSIFLYKPKHSIVARNVFYNGRLGWYSFSGADGLIFEENSVIGADLMSTGGSINALGDIAYSQNVYFGRNKFSLMHGWDREALTTDAGYGFYYGPVKDVSTQSITLVNELSERSRSRTSWKGAGVFILGGKGMGQFTQVERINGNIVYLDRPWKVTPNATSVISITMMQQNYILLDNEFFDAGVAIQYYGTSINHVAAGNKSIRTAGFHNSGRWYRHYQPSWYCHFLDNEIVEGNFYRGGANNAILSGEAVLATYGYQRAPNTAPLVLGAVHRRNHLYSNAHIEIIGRDKNNPGTRDVIVENNIIENADIGLLVDGGSVGVLERGNRFHNVKQPRIFRD